MGKLRAGGCLRILRAKILITRSAHPWKNDRAELAMNTVYLTFESNNLEKSKLLINGRTPFNRCRCTGNSDLRRYLRNWWTFFFFFIFWLTEYSQEVTVDHPN